MRIEVILSYSSKNRKYTPYENVMCKKIMLGSTKKYHGMKRILNLNTNTSLKDIYYYNFHHKEFL